MLRIRLQRIGRKNRPFYRIVVAEKSSSVQGRFVERVGHYNPLAAPKEFVFDEAKIMEWIKQGAKPTDTLARLMKGAGVKGMEPFIIDMPDRKKKKKEEAPSTKGGSAFGEKEEAKADETKKEDRKEEEPKSEEPKEDVKKEKEKERAEEKEDKEEKATEEKAVRGSESVATDRREDVKEEVEEKKEKDEEKEEEPKEEGE